MEPLQIKIMKKFFKFCWVHEIEMKQVSKSHQIRFVANLCNGKGLNQVLLRMYCFTLTQKSSLYFRRRNSQC